MHDFDGMEDLPTADAAVIVSGMRLVAKADGNIHQRELAMIEELGEGLPEADPHTPLQTAEARGLYIRTLGMLALADGAMSSYEMTAIRDLAKSQGLSNAETDDELRAAKRRFFEPFAGVRLFQDQAREIGRNIGLSPEEIDEVLGS